jgi:hypothetical protein
LLALLTTKLVDTGEKFVADVVSINVNLRKDVNIIVVVTSRAPLIANLAEFLKNLKWR